MEVFIDVVGGRKKQNGTLNAFFIEPIHRLLLLRRPSDKTKSVEESNFLYSKELSRL